MKILLFLLFFATTIFGQSNHAQPKEASYLQPIQEVCPLHQIVLNNIESYLYNVNTDFSPRCPDKVDWSGLSTYLAPGYTIDDFSGFPQQRGTWTSFHQYWIAMFSTGVTLSQVIQEFSCNDTLGTYTEEWLKTYSYSSCSRVYISPAVYSYELNMEGQMVNLVVGEDSYGTGDWYSLITRPNCGANYNQQFAEFTKYESPYGLSSVGCQGSHQTCTQPACAQTACSQPVCSQPVCSQPVCSQPACSQPACSQQTPPVHKY